MSLESALMHFKTITRHRHKVIAHCAKAGILWQGLRHDLSKYTPTEFLPGVRFCTGKHSPNEGEREEYGFSQAWMHHKGRNRHHFEYWTDYDPKTKQVKPVKMPLRYVVEMFCDRVAASKIYQGENYKPDSALQYFLNGKAHRKIHPETSRLLERLLRMLSEKGEEATFAYIRHLLKRNKEY